MKKLIAILFIIFFLFGSADAANYYVRPNGHDTNCNGTANVDDSEGVRPACSWKTVLKGMQDAPSGSTVILLGGATGGSEVTYTESGSTWAQYSNITLTCSIDYGCIIKLSTTDPMLNVSSESTGLTIGKVVYDAQGVNEEIVHYIGASGVGPVTFSGTKFLSPLKWAIRGNGGGGALTLTNGWSIVANDTIGGSGYWYLIDVQGATAGNIIIENGTISITGKSTVPVHYIIRLYPTVAGKSCTVQNNTVSVDNTYTGDAGFLLLWAQNCGTYTISGNTISVTASASPSAFEPTSILINNGEAGLETTSCEINHNTITHGTNTGGKAIDIGDDQDSAPANPNAISGAVIEHNTVTGANHGILLAWITGGIARYNTINSTTIGAAAKYSTDSQVYYNLLNGGPMTLGCLYSKGTTSNDLYANNTCIMSTATARGIYLTNNSTGATFKNNIFYSTVAEINRLVYEAGAGDAAAYDNNIYYGTASSGYPFVRSGDAKETFAAWKTALGGCPGAGRDCSSYNADPVFMSSSDFRLGSGSPAINAGTSLSLTSDYAGNPVPKGPAPDIGAYEKSLGGLFQTFNKTNRFAPHRRLH